MGNGRHEDSGDQIEEGEDGENGGEDGEVDAGGGAAAELLVDEGAGEGEGEEGPDELGGGYVQFT